ASTGTPRPQEPPAYTAFSLYGGAAQASLGFGTGATAGLALRIKRESLPVLLRFDIMGSRFSQTPTAFGGTSVLSDKAALTHVGATASLELPIVNHGAIRPYLVAGGGVFRFQANGPAGNNGIISDGVFTATTDGALSAGGGVLLGRHVFVEARYITVGDFNSIPVVLGFVFR
ncbi:MAG: hypothetical protein ABJB74_17280, partial [Gemmatimonas sp.]